MAHFIITNRKTQNDAQGEYLLEDGSESASENLRFARFHPKKFDKDHIRSSIELFPDSSAVLRNQQYSTDELPTYQLGALQGDLQALQGSARFFAELYLAMVKEKGDVLFFIHGFCNDLPDTLEAVCQLEKNYIQTPRNSSIKHIVVFSWPAMSRMLKYRDDAKDAELSGYTLARCYLMLIDFFRAIFLKEKLAPCQNNIHLLAHSMGNRVLENMMLELYRQKGDNLTALFKEVVLAAADVDWQIFESPRAFSNLTNICQRVTVYYNQDDKALFLSETTKNSYNRLGKYGFRGNVPAHVYSVDCTSVSIDGGLADKIAEHSYYLGTKVVVNDILAVFQGQRIEDFVKKTRLSIPNNAKQFRLMLTQK